MIDYLSYPMASLQRVVNPLQQVVGHKYNNVGWGIPRALLGRYYREANPNTKPPTPEWYLEADSPQWDELLPYIDAIKLYTSQYKTSTIGPPGHAEALAAAEELKAKRQKWWADAQALPGADDPMWLYQNKESADEAEDDDIVLVDLNNVDAVPRYPRKELRAKYGYVDFVDWAASQIGPKP